MTEHNGKFFPRDDDVDPDFDPNEPVEITIRVPYYIRRNLQFIAHEKTATQTWMILMGLRQMGVDIRDEDIVRDGRSRRKKK